MNGKKNYKNKTNKFILEYYEKNGFDRIVRLAYEMLKASTHKNDKTFRSHVHGELAESILEIGILDFMSRYPEQTKDWIVEKGMILRDPESNSKRFLTELDMTIFTPYKIVAFECKSYQGDKTFTDKCTVRRPGIKYKDVYSQHEKHYRTLMHNFQTFRIIDENSARVSPLQIAYYDFSVGTVKDDRELKWRRMMPTINPYNLDKFLEVLLDKPTYWKMNYVRRAVDIIGKNKASNTKSHLNYVTSLHNN